MIMRRHGFAIASRSADNLLVLVQQVHGRQANGGVA
jgi:hypothetical protein